MHPVDFMQRICARGMPYFGEIKSNRRVKANPSPLTPWTSLREAFHSLSRQRVVSDWDGRAIREGKKKGKVLTRRVLQIKNRTTPVCVVAVYNRRNSKSPFAYYLSTDRTSTGARCWRLSRARWSIECVFRTCKQNLRFGKLPCASKEAAYLAVELPLYIYVMV